jgi:hypothetical protein
MPKKQGEIIPINIDGVTVTKSPDGQQRVLIKIDQPMLDGPTNSNTYRNGSVAKHCVQLPTSSRAEMIGGTLSAHPGVRLIIFQSTRGVYVNVNLEHPKLKRLLRVLAIEMRKFADEFATMLERRAKLHELLQAETTPSNP